MCDQDKQQRSFNCKQQIGFVDDTGKWLMNSPRIIMKVQDGGDYDFCSPECLTNYYRIISFAENYKWGTPLDEIREAIKYGKDAESPNLVWNA